MSNEGTRKLAVTITEAVALSGIGRSSLYKLFADGALIPRKSGKRTLILVADLEKHIAELPPANLIAPDKKLRVG